MRLAAQLVKLNIFRLRRRLLLLAAMAAAFAVLSAPLGAGAENMLSRESVEPLSIAVCGEEAGLISRLAGNMARCRVALQPDALALPLGAGQQVAHRPAGQVGQRAGGGGKADAARVQPGDL